MKRSIPATPGNRIGTDTSILLYGSTQGADDMGSALTVEKLNLQNNYGIRPNEYSFADGSGGGETTAVNQAVTQLLADMYDSPTFPQYYVSLPIPGVDDSLAPAKGQVRAKPGTLVDYGAGNHFYCMRPFPVDPDLLHLQDSLFAGGDGRFILAGALLPVER